MRRRRPLPGGRAVVGGLLVAGSGVGIFLAYLDASSPPDTRYLVAMQEIPAGTTIEDQALALELFGATAIDLPAHVATQAIPEAQLSQIVGEIVVAQLAEGSLVSASMIAAPDQVPASHMLTVALAPSDALGGGLRAGSVVDVLATSTVAGDATTAVVARRVPVVDVEHGSSGGLTTSDVAVLLALDSLEQVQAVGHAARTAAVFLSRPSEGDDSAHVPPPFRWRPPDDAVTGVAPHQDESHG